MSRREPALALIICMSMLFSCSATPEGGADDPPQTPSVAVHAARMLDPRTGKYVADPLIVITAGKVAEIRTGTTAPAGTRLIDLGSATVLPGLIDAHTHITYHFDEKGLFGASGDPNTDVTLRYAEDNARRTIDAGFTTIRNLGADGLVDLRLRDLTASGGAVGPRIIASGEPFTPDLIYGRPQNDRIEIIKQFVEARVREGVDVIKLFEGVDHQGRPYISADEVRVAVDIAHAAGLKVAVHAHEAVAMIAAVNGGCDSIEHGSFGTAAAFDLMAGRHVPLVPTLYLPTHYLDHKSHFVFDASTWDFFRRLQSVNLANVRLARSRGVKIVSGSDAVAGLHGVNEREPEWLVKAGLTPLEAIHAATIDAADLLGLAGKAGEISPGSFGDLIAVSGDPANDINALDHVVFVMKAGTVIKSSS